MIELGKGFELNLEKLIATRMVACANSGGGKSYLLRRTLEQTHGKVQQIILDLEGEFSTLREKFDYLLVGKEGEIPISIQTADLLARKLLELNVSTIIDLSELKKHERILFVKRFLVSLVDAPKELYHPVIIVIDEAHEFAPESGKCESTGAVIDLMTRGRKRGFCGMLATQRISKLNKDAIAEANNYIIGRTGLDIDMKRASEILGLTTKDDMRALRDLEPGTFHAFGPAFSHTGVKRVSIGPVQTTHPDRTRGILIKQPTKTPENIKKLLKDIVDLPKEAEEELRTKQDYENKITQLKRELTLEKSRKPIANQISPALTEKERQMIRDQVQREFQKQGDLTVKKLTFHYQTLLRNASNSYQNLYKKVEAIKKAATEALVLEFKMDKDSLKVDLNKLPPQFVQESKFTPKPILVDAKTLERANNMNYDPEDTETKLSTCASKIYSFLFNHVNRSFTIQQLGAATGYKCTGGGFKNELSKLKTMGLITKNGDTVQIKEVDQSYYKDYNFSKENIKSNLDKCELEIYNVLLENPQQEFTFETLAELTPSNYSPTGGGYKNSISRLRTLGLLLREGTTIKLHPDLLSI